MKTNFWRLVSLKDICVLILLVTGVFYWGNIIYDGSLRKPENLTRELKSPPDSLYLWNISKEAPFKYRILHRVIVSETYALLTHQNDSRLFFSIYKGYALVFQAAAVLAFYLLLIFLNLNRAALWGAILFIFLPPILMAYSIPVHTREDTLAYLLLIMGLACIIKNHFWGMLVVFALSVTCRETLLLLPLVNLLFNNKQRVWVRLTVFIGSLLLFISIRLIMGSENYNVWEGLQWNLAHTSQVIAFLFVSFGFLWLPFLLWIPTRTKSQGTAFFHRSSFVVLAVILSTTFFGGIFNEIRLLYLLAPWVIVGSIELFFLKQKEIAHRVASRYYLLFAVILALIFIGTILLLSGKLDNLKQPDTYTIPHKLWVIVASLHLYLTCISLPLLFKQKPASR